MNPLESESLVILSRLAMSFGAKDSDMFVYFKDLG